MMTEDIKTLLLKYINDECSSEELEAVVQYFRQHNGTDELPEVEEVLEILKNDPSLDFHDGDSIFKQILKKANLSAPKAKTRPIIFWRYAAAFLLLASSIGGLLYYVNLETSVSNQTMTHEEGQDQNTKEEFITLELDNGEIEIIRPNTNKSIVDGQGRTLGEQKLNSLSYTGGGVEMDQLIYNTLTVPYGQRFKVVLSDGTEVDLNAGTQLKYPIRFLETEGERSVSVIGEAYFDVVENRDLPFIVHSGDLNVRVLGTTFNLSNYPEDDESNVVLVQGSVQLFVDSIETQSDYILKSGEKGSFDKENKDVFIRPVSTNIYTSWVQGELLFRNMTFEDMLKKMERHFNVEIVNENQELALEKFNASFGEVTLDKILDYLKMTYNVEYERLNGRLVIK
ncbi:FecR family protein [Membranihabitans marinus]|uniref:FecR family protein n=1 Tax=Membranihabitans marinus TaxID=1227546 RepID=UPI001F2616F6|nr:FecR domain-containing protein [Membranihabitans marinus]